MHSYRAVHAGKAVLITVILLITLWIRRTGFASMEDESVTHAYAIYCYITLGSMLGIINSTTRRIVLWAFLGNMALLQIMFVCP